MAAHALREQEGLGDGGGGLRPWGLPSSGWSMASTALSLLQGEEQTEHQRRAAASVPQTFPRCSQGGHCQGAALEHGRSSLQLFSDIANTSLRAGDWSR